MRNPPPRIIPPLWLLMCATLAFVLHRISPRSWLLLSDGLRLSAAIIVLAGLGLVLLGARRFNRAGTPIIPGTTPTALVMGGVYRHTRNPMYLGMLVVLIGMVLMLGSPLPIAAPVLFVVVITRQYIRREEALLRNMFEHVYDDYCARTRRWI